MAADPADVKELTTKLTALVRKRFGAGNWAAAHAAYDKDRDGRISAAELDALLEAAGVGNGFTRGSWVLGVIEELDKDADEGISLPELERVLAARAPAAPAQGTPRPDYLFPATYGANFTPKNPNPKPKPKAKAAAAEPEEDSASDLAGGLFLVLVLGAAAYFVLRGSR